MTENDLPLMFDRIVVALEDVLSECGPELLSELADIFAFHVDERPDGALSFFLAAFENRRLNSGDPGGIMFH
jgi:hypothetical protein